MECNMEFIVIRNETEADYGAVESLVRESFWNVYRPGCFEHYVIHRLRDDPAFVKDLDLVMEKDGVLIGQNMFMHAVIKADDGRDIPILTMGPICISPKFKRKGYGKILLDHSLELAAKLGCGAICFEGNIHFYGKSGFTFAREFGIRYHDLPEGADDSFFLCKELIPDYLSGVTGEYCPPEGYFCCETERMEFERFEAQFPPKEKKVLPGQLGYDLNTVWLDKLAQDDREQFILDNQEAFNFGALEELGQRDEHFEEDGEIISRKTIEDSIDGGEAYRIMRGNDKVGGVVISIDGDRGDLELLFVSPREHSKGIGYAAWCEVEKLHPEVRVWETVTPYFEKRNIHFYVNRCGFHIIEYYNSHHPDPNDPDGHDDENEQDLDGMFRFRKVMF